LPEAQRRSGARWDSIPCLRCGVNYERTHVVSGAGSRGETSACAAYLDVAAVERLVARVTNAATLKASILAYQTSAADAGRVAQAAGVKTLVLSHLIPADDPDITERMWVAAAQSTFRGTVIVGKDLLEV